MKKFLEGFLMSILCMLLSITILFLFFGGFFLMTKLPYWWNMEIWARVLHFLIFAIIFIATLFGITNMINDDDNNVKREQHGN
jgi:protein-S-isoprenylcysteine O-methyltransferase Ste14